MEYPRLHIGRKKLISYAMIAVVFGGVLGGTLWNIGGIYFPKPSLKKFSSYQELVAFLKRDPQAPKSLFERFQAGFQPLWTQSDFNALTRGAAPSEGGIPDFSTTNIQVAGVDEADIVKTDGEYIYLVAGSVVYILRAYSPPEDAEVLSKLDLNTTIAGIFVNGDKLVVFNESSGFYGPEILYRTYIPYYGTANTSILVYDLSNRSDPVLERDVSIDGYYFNSRMIGDYIYAVINKPAQLINDTVVYLPVVSSGNSKVEIDATSVYYVNLADYSHSFTNIVALNVQDVEEEPTVETFLLGGTSCLYVSKENLYLVSPAYQTSGTSIFKLSIRESEITWAANGTVPGYVLNQFSMDEYGDLFRIATSNRTSNNVYVLDEDLNVIGKLEGLAPGEDIYSARFMGNRCYLVTFRQIDPLFVIDLENPEDPRVLGKLKIPGYSSYLHPYDEDHLIGVGKEVVEGRETGVKISLFDVSNVSSPKEIDKVEIGGSGSYSPVLQDHKAFLFSRSKHLLVLPVFIYNTLIVEGVVQKEFWQGAYVYNLSVVEGFVLKGAITHIEDQTDISRLWEYHLKRALYIGQVLYTISDKKVKINSLENLEEIGVVNLP